MKYDVFISYRRSGGAIKAELMKAVLRQRGFQDERIFMDTYSLPVGNYREELKKAIHESNNMIVLITKGCFDGLSAESNWVLELEEAVRCRKNIIPVYFDDITDISNESLPESIKDFPLANAVLYSQYYAKASYDKICDFIVPDQELLEERRNAERSQRRNRLVKTSLIILATLSLIILSVYIYGRLVTKTPEGGDEAESVAYPLPGLVTGEDPVFVDLGLPSGTRWLDRNLGADVFYDYGYYFAFRETYTKPSFQSDQYVTYTDNDEPNLMPADYDAAWVISSGAWRLPEERHFEELIANCTWEEVEYHGVKGRLVTGPSGKSIFLPAAGMKTSQGLQYANSYGYYWTSTLVHGSGSRFGRELLFAPNQQVGNGWSYYGRTIRPIEN